MNKQPITLSAPSCPPLDGAGSCSGQRFYEPSGRGARIAIFPGSFDPFTIGHADIVRRGLELFDRIVIAVGYNAQKASGTPVDERVAAIQRWAATLPATAAAPAVSSEAAAAALSEAALTAATAAASSPAAASAAPSEAALTAATASPAASICAVNNAAIVSPRIKVVSYSCLTADLAAQEGARFLLRGVRSVKDFEYERDMAAVNAAISTAPRLEPPAPTSPVSERSAIGVVPSPPAREAKGCAEAPLETVLLIADPRYAHISSTVVRELQAYGRDVTPYLP